MKAGILDQSIFETPIGVLDFETTGLSAGTDRVVEVSVVRMDPGCKPEVVLDTLINPHRRVSATEIHGITDDDVADAPEFAEVANDVVHALSDCVVASYNVYFDMRFLNYELERSGISDSPPHMCLMYLRTMLGLGGRCSLGDACQSHEIPYGATHVAADDAIAAARLMEVYFDILKNGNIRTFEELAALKKYKFINSFRYDPFRSSAGPRSAGVTRLKSRSAPAIATGAVPIEAADEPVTSQASRRLGIYWDALKAVVADLQITDAELQYLRQKEDELGLHAEQVRMLHARIFAAAIAQFIDDQWLDDKEERKLKRLHKCLSRLGWAPGE